MTHGGRAGVATAPCPLCAHGGGRFILQIHARRMVRCDRCGLVYRDPSPARTNDGAPLVLGPAERAREERVAERRRGPFERLLAEAGPPARLLDVGAGLGYFVKLAGERGWQATGVDVDAAAVEYARSVLGVDVRPGDLRDLHLPAASFDLVTLWNLLECVADPVDVLSEVRRVTAPAGRVFIRTQNAAWHLTSYRASRLLRRFGIGANPARGAYVAYIFNVVCFSAPTLRDLLVRTGFKPVRVVNSPPVPGDPYLGLSSPAERALGLAKRGVFAAVQAGAALTRGRWLMGPSIEAWGRRTE